MADGESLRGALADQHGRLFALTNCQAELLATKSVSQQHWSTVLQELLRECLVLTYNCIQYGNANGIRNRKGMKGFYRSLKGVNLPSYYKVATVTRACAVLESRLKSRRRGKETRHNKPLKPMVCITGGFFITAKGRLFVSLGHEKYEVIQLNRYVQSKLSGMKIRSLTIRPYSISFCLSKEVEVLPVKTVHGMDRNEKNLTFGNVDTVSRVDVSNIVKVKQRTREIVASFKRDDIRIRKKISSKYWNRANGRCDQMLHDATNQVIEAAKRAQAAIALEDLTGVNKLYGRGNGKSKDYRFRMNQWPYRKALGMIAYKGPWKGLTMVQLTKAETRGSSMMHFACGEKLRRPERGDAAHRRMLWCEACKVWVDRDENAAVNLSTRGLARLASSLPGRTSKLSALEKGPTGEVMNGNPSGTLSSAAIPGADAGKFS